MTVFLDLMLSLFLSVITVGLIGLGVYKIWPSLFDALKPPPYIPDIRPNFHFLMSQMYSPHISDEAKAEYIRICDIIIATYKAERLDPSPHQMTTRGKIRPLAMVESELFNRYRQFENALPDRDDYPPFPLFPPDQRFLKALTEMVKDPWFLPLGYKSDKVVGYLSDHPVADTPFLSFAQMVEPFQNGVRRFEGTFILAPSGSGKTTLLNYLIDDDFQYVPDVSIVAMDSTGDFLKNITAKAPFHPVNGVYKDNLIVIEPDVETPLALNPFEFGRSRLKRQGAKDREKMANNTIDLLAHVFSTIGDGAKFTPRQALLFRQGIRLCLEIPQSNISTLANILTTTSVDQHAEHIAKLDQTAQDFWNHEFRTVDFKKVCAEVSWRLAAVLENATFAKMLNAPDCKVDFFKALNDGSVIVVNTDRDTIGLERAGIFGRLIISLIRLAMRERDTLPEKERRPVYFYIDEVHEHLDNDDQVAVMIDDVRKSRLALIMVTQRLAKIKDGNVRDALLSCGILMAKPNADDAQTVAKYMQARHDDLNRLPKHTFALYSKDVTPQVSVTCPNFQPEWELSKAEQARTIKASKARYGYTPKKDAPKRDVPKPVPPIDSVKVEEPKPEQKPLHENIKPSKKL